MKTSTKQNWEQFWKQKSDVTEVYANSDRIRRHLMGLMDLRGARVLEVGAGTGRDSLYMREDGAVLYMLDYSMNSLKIIRSTMPETAGVHAIGGDAFSLPFQDGTFDVVFHQGLLEHFRPGQAEALLKENVRVLKSGGLLVVDVPQRWHVYTVIKHVLIAANAWFAGWEREFSVRELRHMLGDLGLTVRHAYGEWMYPSLGYRMLREAAGKIGVRLPLYPTILPPLSRLRNRLRTALDGSWIKLNTSLSIGVIGQKS